MIKEILNTWLGDVKKDLIKNYDKLGLRASGKWANSLEEFAKITQFRINAGILGERYTGALESGRKPTKSKRAGRPTLRQLIRVWIDDKKIIPKGKISKDSLAYLIARKIHEKGIRVPNKYNKGGLVSDVVTRARIDQLNEQLSLFYVEGVRSTILKELK
jgi:hypothetical protein